MADQVEPPAAVADASDDVVGHRRSRDPFGGFPIPLFVCSDTPKLSRGVERARVARNQLDRDWAL